jgi:predicted ester cyclase
MDGGDHNKAAVRACLETISQDDSGALDRVLSPDYVLHDPALGDEVRGVEGLRELLEEYRKAIGGAHLTIDHQFTDGDYVATRWFVRGRHQGALMGAQPSGAEVAFSGVTISRCLEGRIVEEWEICDTLGLLQQIGALPATVES